MNVVSMVPGLIMLTAVAWVHYRLAAYDGSTRWLLTIILSTVALAFAGLVARVYASEMPDAALAIFISAFALAHVPAAAVLQLKHWRHTGNRQTSQRDDDND